MVAIELFSVFPLNKIVVVPQCMTYVLATHILQFKPLEMLKEAKYNSAVTIYALIQFSAVLQEEYL